MEITITIPGLLAFAGTILLLGAAPTASSLLVAGSALSHGQRQGCAVTVGIAVADTIFALAAMLGLAAFVATVPVLFAAMKILCALVLMWMAVGLWRSQQSRLASAGPRQIAPGRGFIAGMLVTFADQKAILFYAALIYAGLFRYRRSFTCRYCDRCRHGRSVGVDAQAWIRPTGRAKRCFRQRYLDDSLQFGDRRYFAGGCGGSDRFGIGDGR